MSGDRYFTRKARVEDANLIEVRDEDWHEWEASAKGGLYHLPWSIQVSAECFTTIDTHKVKIVGIGGLVEHEGDDIPYVWMLMSPGYEGVDGVGLMHTLVPYFLDTLLPRWPVCQCYSDVRNPVHHRWLNWMGFERIATVPWGPYNMPFHHYVRGLY